MTAARSDQLLRISDSARGTTIDHVDAARRRVGESTSDGRDLVYELDEANDVVSKPGLSRLEITDGNRLLGSDRETFEYDDRDRLIARRARDGSLTRYTYDSLDMLVRLERAQLANTQFRDCDFRGTNFDDATFDRVTFDGCRLDPVSAAAMQRRGASVQ